MASVARRLSLNLFIPCDQQDARVGYFAGYFARHVRGSTFAAAGCQGYAVACVCFRLGFVELCAMARGAGAPRPAYCNAQTLHRSLF